MPLFSKVCKCCILGDTVWYGRKAKTLVTVVCSFSIPFSTAHNAQDHESVYQRCRMRYFCKDGKARRTIIGGQNFTKQKERRAFSIKERTESSIQSIVEQSLSVRCENMKTPRKLLIRVANIWVSRARVFQASVNALKSCAWDEGKEIGVGRRWKMDSAGARNLREMRE